MTVVRPGREDVLERYVVLPSDLSVVFDHLPVADQCPNRCAVVGEASVLWSSVVNKRVDVALNQQGVGCLFGRRHSIKSYSTEF